MTVQESPRAFPKEILWVLYFHSGLTPSFFFASLGFLCGFLFLCALWASAVIFQPIISTDEGVERSGYGLITFPDLSAPPANTGNIILAGSGREDEISAPLIKRSAKSVKSARGNTGILQISPLRLPVQATSILAGSGREDASDIRHQTSDFRHPTSQMPPVPPASPFLHSMPSRLSHRKRRSSPALPNPS
jgi:hypothetical protein